MGTFQRFSSMTMPCPIVHGGCKQRDCYANLCQPGGALQILWTTTLASPSQHGQTALGLSTPVLAEGSCSPKHLEGAPPGPGDDCPLPQPAAFLYDTWVGQPWRVVPGGTASLDKPQVARCPQTTFSFIYPHHGFIGKGLAKGLFATETMVSLDCA